MFVRPLSVSWAESRCLVFASRQWFGGRVQAKDWSVDRLWGTLLAGFMLMLLCAMVVVSHFIGLWQWLAAWRFPLHQRADATGFAPPLSVLKPLKGSEPQTADCLRSWLQQPYAGPVQFLFGVHDPNDPVCDVVRSLLVEFPHCDAQLVICPARPGANAKVGTLVQLEALVTHDVILVSDADVRVPADFLAQVVQPLQTSRVDLVNCFYALANPATVAQQWEAIATNSDFWSQVLQSRTLKSQDFALGAVMAVRRRALEGIGGFAALVNHLADDYQLGHRVQRKGGEIALSPVVVECWDAPAGWRAVWAHQLRWARTVRVCQPGPYAASIITNVTLWTLAAMGAGYDQPWVLLGGSVMLGLRMAFARGLAQRLGSWSPSTLRSLWLVPLRDLLGAVIWTLAFFGNHVTWRGVTYRVGRDGTLRIIAG